MKKRILIVDDNINNLYMLQTLLRGNDFEAIPAENGKEALDKALDNPPDMIITDILMPVMDGYTLCREWKSSKILKDIPLIFYTATYTDPKDESFAMSLGADRFVLKPQNPDVLISIVKEVMEGNKSTPKDPGPLSEEMAFLRKHDEILFRKLEKKMLDLETANQELRALQERYRLSFENVMDIICTIDIDRIISDISPSAQSLLGYNPQDIKGQPLSELERILTLQSFDQITSEVNAALNGEKIRASVHQIITSDGDLKAVEVSTSPIMKEGSITGVVLVGRDITDRKRIEDALRESEKKYRLLADNSNDVIFVLDMDLNYTYVSPSVKILRGYEPEEVVERPTHETVTPQSWEVAMQNLSEAIELEKSVPLVFRTVELEMIRKDGSTVWTEVKASFIRDKNQQPVAILGVARDITDRRQTENRLQETLQNLHRAVETTIQVMVAAVEARDPYTAGHQLRVANTARAIATEMGLPQEKIDGIFMVGSIHDIGKLSVPAEILVKPAILTDVEFSLIKEHPLKGYEILKDVESPWPLAEVVYQHHERMDGSGYPRGLRGDEITTEARILAVADVVEAMASHRPYRASLGIEKALDEILKNSGKLYDKDVVNACYRLFNNKGYHFE